MTESGLNILVVDDDMLARMTAAQCLKREGHTASMAYGGERALEMLNSGNYDLVLLDLLMPDIDGLEVLRHIKEDPRLDSIPVIMVSGDEEAETIARCDQMGAAAHLSKPLDPAQLATRITACMKGSR